MLFNGVVSAVDSCVQAVISRTYKTVFHKCLLGHKMRGDLARVLERSMLTQPEKWFFFLKISNWTTGIVIEFPSTTYVVWVCITWRNILAWELNLCNFIWLWSFVPTCFLTHSNAVDREDAVRSLLSKVPPIFSFTSTPTRTDIANFHSNPPLLTTK